MEGRGRGGGGEGGRGGNGKVKFHGQTKRSSFL